MNSELFNVDTALLTQRTVVRRFREGEGPALRELVYQNREELQDHFPMLVGEVADTDHTAETFVRQRIAAWLLQQDFAFGVWDNETTQLIGYAHLFDFNWEVPTAELSYFMNREHSKAGIMTEVLARVIRFGFRQVNLEKIYVKMLSDNFASQRVARKNGFAREGDLRNEFRRPGGQLADLVRFGLTRETYGE